MRIRKGIVASMAVLVLLGVLSCNEQEDRVFDNPNDPEGTNYSPPSVELLEHRVVAGMRDTVEIKGLWKDPSEGSRVTTSLWKHSGFFADSQEVEGDTVVGRLVFDVPGTYRVSVAVRDDRGVWSAGVDTVRVDVHRYEPSTTIRSLSDSVEPGDTARFAMSARDTSGRIVRYVWFHDGRTDTTGDSTLAIATTAVGTRYVTGYVVDDDGNVSSQVNAMVVVAYRRPTVKSPRSASDTMRVMVGTSARLVFGASDPPDDPDGKAVVFRWNTDDGRKGSFKPGDTLTLLDSVAKLVRLDVVAVDKDSLASDPAATVWVRFHSKEPQISFPGQGALLTDTIVKFRWIPGALDSSYELFVDTVPDPARSFGKTRADSLEVKLPFGNRLCYARVVGRKGGDSAASSVVAFSTPEDVARATTLASLTVDDASFDTAFMPLDTLYRVHVAGTATSVTLRVTGSVNEQVIQCGGNQTTTSMIQTVNLTTIPMTIPVTVWSRDGERSRVYRIVVTRDVSEYVKLAELSVEGYELVPSFHPDTTSYTVPIARGDSGKVTWRTANNLANVTIAHNGGMDSWNSEPYLRGATQDTAGMLLTVGRAGVVNNTYRIRARILPARETRLQSLYWKYNEYFNVDSTYVMRTVGEGTDSVWITPTLRDGQTMKVNGTLRTSGEFKIDLKPGLNTTSIRVIAEDGATTRDYAVVFYRTPSKDNNLISLQPIKGTLDRPFDASWASYRVAMPFEWDSASVRASLSSNRASMRVVRMHGSDTDTVVVASGDTVPVQRLGAKDSTLWRIVVLAEDTSLQKSYEVRFTRALPDTFRQLYSLFLGSSQGWLYTSDGYGGGTDTLVRASVGYNDSLVMFAPNWYDTWKIRSVTAAWDSGSVHRLDTLRSGFYDTLVPKANDTTTVSLEITAQDSSLKRTIRMRIFRSAASKDSTLSWIDAKTRLGSVNARWNSPDSVWRLEVPWQDSVITFRPYSTDQYARRIVVGGRPVATNTWLSDSIRLATVGDTNRIAVTVTAQDTSCKRTYTVNVYRKPMRTDATLVALGQSTGLLSPKLNLVDTAYMLTVGSAVTSVTIAPQAQDSSQATIAVDGGGSTGTVDLGNIGDTTTFRIVVTAQDPSVKRTYVVSILREKDPSALYGTIAVDSTLTIQNSPYLVNASVTIKSGATLTIDPGVRILFSTGRGLTVKGTLKALGTAAKPIVFTRATAGNWGYIMFDSTAESAMYDANGEYLSGSILRNCVIEYSGSASMTNAAALYLKKRAPHLDATTIQYSETMGVYSDSLVDAHWSGLVVKGNTKTGMLLRARKFHLRQSTISDNARGLDLVLPSGFATPTEWVRIDSSRFLRNAAQAGSGDAGGGGGVRLAIPNYMANAGATLRGNLFESNSAAERGGGVYLDRNWNSSGNLTVQGNTFRKNSADIGGALYLKHYCSGYTTRFQDNRVEDNAAREVGGIAFISEGNCSQTEDFQDSGSVYHGNRSNGTGGYAAGLYVNVGGAKTWILDARFEENISPSAGHGALEIAAAYDTAVVRDGRFVGNSGADAGAVRIGTLARLQGNLFQANTTSKTVAAVLWTNSAAGRIIDNTFSGNGGVLLAGRTVMTNSVAMRIDGSPVLRGNNILSGSTDRLVATANSSSQADVDANDNWWGAMSPRFDLVLADKNADLDDATSYAAFDVSTVLTSPNASAPATE